MKNKYILENLETNNLIEYKTLRDIAKDLKVEYFQIRELRLNNMKRQKKFFHNQHKLLSSKYKIKDISTIN
jgi:hypothetical protein